MEVPTIYKAYIYIYMRPKFQGISPQNMARNMVRKHVPPFYPGIPIELVFQYNPRELVRYIYHKP